MKITEILKQVSSAAGVAKKVEILRANRSKVLDEIFDWAYNPDKMYGITSNQIVGHTLTVLNSLDIGDYWEVCKGHLGRLANKQDTGLAAKKTILTLLEFLDKDSQTIILNILDKNLKIGIGLDVYQKEVMGIKPTKFQVTLAQHIEDVKNVDVLDGTWFASRKCDGVRCVAFYDSTTREVKFMSRQGKEFTTLDNLKPAVADFCHNLIGRWVLDGELCKIDENGDEHFDQIVGECKKKNYTIESCCYQLFDICLEREFYGQYHSLQNFNLRLTTLETMERTYTPEGKCFIKVLLQERIKSQEDFDRWSKYVEDGNWEGFMLRKNVPFEVGRTKNLLKVKKFHDAEFVVKDVERNENFTVTEPGKGTSTIACVSNLVIEYKGSEVRVGSGLTKKQRLEWYDCPDHIIGKTICVKYFQESKDKDGKLSLRFPTLKYVYEDGRNV